MVQGKSEDGRRVEYDVRRSFDVHTKPATAQPHGRVARARADERASGRPMGAERRAVAREDG